MPSIPEAIDVLRAALRRKGVESHVQDAFNHLASCLVLLNSSSPSLQMIRKLCTVLRQPLLPLYNACFRPALQLSSCVLFTVLGKLCDAHNVEDERFRAAWDATAEVILSGILDFLDQKDSGNVESDSTVWEVLYRIICEFFFLDSAQGLPLFSIPLYLSAYNTLTETAARQVNVRNALRHKAILGGERLGTAISRTRDYLLLEALLMLFARLLPPVHNTSQGKFKRLKFVKEVLGSPKLFQCSTELLDIMQKTSGTHWDDVAAQIIDALARNDITYPQPFPIDEIDVCGRVFPQPLATDRLILDKQAFLANIVTENDNLCESLQVSYSRIRTITLDNSEQNVPKGKVSIMVYLMSPPLVANVEMESPDENNLHARFLLQSDAVGRFMEALRRRGVGKLSFLNPLATVKRKRKSISIGLGLKFANDSSPILPAASFEGKVQHVNQVYKTDIEDSNTPEVVPVPHVRVVGLSPLLDRKPAVKNERLVPEVLESVITEDVPIALKSAMLVSPTGGASTPIQNLASPLSPGHSTAVKQLFGDDDELSEISEFEPDNVTVDERTPARLSTSFNYELKPTQRKVDRMLMNETPNAASTMRIKRSTKSAVSGIGGRKEEVAQRSAETGNPPPTSNSPIFGSSSSTQINASPKLPLNVENDFLGTDRLKELGNNEYRPSDTEPTIASEGKPQTGFSSVEKKLGQHASRFTPSSDSDQKVHSRIEVTKDMSVPPKIVGTRRKRETIKASRKAAIEFHDEYTPPRKKIRDDKLGNEEENIKSTETLLDAVSTSRVKGHANTTIVAINPTTVDFDELPELKSTCQATRRSSRIKKKQMVATGGRRANALRDKAQEGRQAEGRLTCGTERKKLATVSLQDTGIKISHDTPPIPGLRSIPTLIRKSHSPEINSHVLSVEMRNVESIAPETGLPQEMLKTSNLLPCEVGQPSATQVKESREDLEIVQQATSDLMQLTGERSRIRTQETVNDRHPLSNLHTVDNDVNRDLDVVEYSASLKDGAEHVEPSQPIMESTPPTKPVTIDLTNDNSPAQEEKGVSYKASNDRVHSDAYTQRKFGTSNVTDCIIEEPAFVPSPRHRCRNVTFASPIEYVREINTSHVNAPRRRWSRSPSESNILSPLATPTGSAIMKHESPDRITMRGTVPKTKSLQASEHNQIADEVDIQDIVEVLDGIQAVLGRLLELYFGVTDQIRQVIIKSISNRFRNIRKDVQRGRDELIQQVLSELQGMVTENAKYFNGLVRLEEDYHKNGQAITCCWEELIDCNDGLTAQFQDALKEHDRNISARTFPKSLLPLQPAFLCRRENA